LWIGFARGPAREQLEYFDLPMHPICFFIDLDGVLYDGHLPIPGGPEAIEFLRANGNPMLLVTNTSRKSVTAVVANLERFGYAFGPDLVYTAPMATLEYLRSRFGSARLFMLTDRNLDILFEQAGHHVTRSEEAVDAVIIGGSQWPHFGEIDIAQRLDGGLKRIGTGPIVAALESVIERPVTVIGKPNPNLFRLALAHSGFRAQRTVMIGDTPDIDIAGARAAGLRALLVRSGNHRVGEDAGGADWVIGSIAELPEWYRAVFAGNG
jgi:ribonucleotide monophosphatase NagD (HAD superfamily)